MQNNLMNIISFKFLIILICKFDYLTKNLLQYKLIKNIKEMPKLPAQAKPAAAKPAPKTKAIQK